jgi:hypothetical protein
MMKRIGMLALALLSPATLADGGTLKLSAELSAEARWFVQDAAYAEQSGDDVGLSFALLPELYYAWNRDTSVTLRPFARWDSIDDERTHVDLRELMLQHRFGNFDLRAGVGRVFWGVTESVHLVDIVNQTDLVENPDGEQKLGQPMLSLAWATNYGSFAGYLLPYFRERTLPGPEARLRAPLPYAIDDAVYESSAEQKRVDAALRWSLSTSLLDIGVSHFSGTARDPRFELALTETGASLVPVYDLIEQTGLDLNVVTGGWIWKLEAIHQSNRVEDFTAAAGGFEYTFSAPFGTGWDVGALAEYLWDSRGSDSPSPFQRDLFVGTRIAANDVAGSELLAGAIFDLERGGAFGNVEASRRVGDSGKIVVELRLFMDADEADPLFFLRRDDYLQVEYIRYF